MCQATSCVFGLKRRIGETKSSKQDILKINDTYKNYKRAYKNKCSRLANYWPSFSTVLCLLGHFARSYVCVRRKAKLASPSCWSFINVSDTGSCDSPTSCHYPQTSKRTNLRGCQYTHTHTHSHTHTHTHTLCQEKHTAVGCIAKYLFRS